MLVSRVGFDPGREADQVVEEAAKRKLWRAEAYLAYASSRLCEFLLYKISNVNNLS